MTTPTLRFLVVTAALSMAAGLAQAQNADQSTKPAATPAAQSAVTPASSSTAKTAAAAKPAEPATAATPAKADPQAQLIRDARSAGFKPETVRGVQMFCRTARELGSSFPVRTCYDADDVKVKIQEYQAQRNQLEQMHNTGLFTH